MYIRCNFEIHHNHVFLNGVIYMYKQYTYKLLDIRGDKNLWIKMGLGEMNIFLKEVFGDLCLCTARPPPPPPPPLSSYNCLHSEKAIVTSEECMQYVLNISSWFHYCYVELGMHNRFTDYHWILPIHEKDKDGLYVDTCVWMHHHSKCDMISANFTNPSSLDSPMNYCTLCWNSGCFGIIVCWCWCSISTNYLAPEGVARHCFHPVCLSVCVSVCVSGQYFCILFLGY